MTTQQLLDHIVKKKMTRSQLINSLILTNHYTRYLEIGVNTNRQPGYNYDSVVIDVKHGVDPVVDTTYKMTSDEYFSKHITMKYDIIFIDGLHLFEQAHRDIVNSLQWLSENGVIIVHDCNPTKEITQRRERASDVWHGDVWKAILKLRMENPDISIHTIDTDEGCAVIKKGVQEIFVDEKHGTDIFSWDYFEANRQKILNLISVRQFKRMLGSAL